MKVNMNGWVADYHNEAGTYKAVVTGSGEDTNTKNGKEYYWISFAIDGKQYKQEYYLKDGKNSFFTRDCISIMGNSDMVLSDGFDTDLMNGKLVELVITTWGDNNDKLTISSIKRLGKINKEDVPF